jgi:hypothetical protein
VWAPQRNLCFAGQHGLGPAVAAGQGLQQLQGTNMSV